MSNKRKKLVLNYNGQRIDLDTIAGYQSISLRVRHEPTEYGVRFDLRSGTVIEQLGDDIVSRNKVLKYLDGHFKPDEFTANKCQACEHHEDGKKNDCYSKHSCNSYGNWKGFQRMKDNA
jgi:hypothetical protein